MIRAFASPLSTGPVCIGPVFGLLVAAVLPMGCSAEANVPRIVVIQSDVVIEGINNPNRVIATTRTTFDHPVGFEIPDFFEAKLFPRGAVIRIHPQPGEPVVTDFEFVDEMTLLLATRDSSLPPREVAHFIREEGLAVEVGGSLTIPTADEFNVVEYWGAGDAYYELSLTGLLPSETWSLDLTAEFEGSLAL